MAHWAGSQVYPKAQVPRPGSIPAAVSGLLLCRQPDSTSFKKLSQGCSDSSGKARGRVRRRSKRRACLLLGAWLLRSPAAGHLQHASISILCVLSLSIWEGHGPSLPLCPQALNPVHDSDIFSVSLAAWAPFLLRAQSRYYETTTGPSWGKRLDPAEAMS